jgi:hypothetical protein
MMCTSYMSNYYLYFFYKLLIIKKLEKNNRAADDMYIPYVKRYIIKTYSGLEM